MMPKVNISRLISPDPVRAELQRDVRETAIEPASGENKAKTAGDKLDISSRGAEVGRLIEQLKAMPDVRQERIDELRALVSGGKYDPSSESIADAILKDDTL